MPIFVGNILDTIYSQFTKLTVNINDSPIDYKPENLASRIVFVVENVKVFIVCLGIQLCISC